MIKVLPMKILNLKRLKLTLNNTLNSRVIVTSFLMILVFTTDVIAQIDTTDLPSDSILVQKDISIDGGQFEPQFYLISPLTRPPSEEYFNFELPEINYNFSTPTPVIKPLRYVNEPRPTGNDGYLKLGYGNYNHYLADAGYYYSVTDWAGFGANLFLHKANDKNATLKNFTNAEVDLLGHLFLNKNIKLLATSKYEYNTIGNRNLTQNIDSIFPESINYFNFKTGVSLIGTPYQSSQFIYGANFSLSFFSKERTTANEQMFNTGFFLDKMIFNKVGFYAKLRYEYAISRPQDFINLTSLLQVQTNAYYNQNGLKVEAGIYLTDSIAHLVDPYAHIEYTLPSIPITISAFVKNTSNIQGFASTFNINPFSILEFETMQIYHKHSYGLEVKFGSKNYKINLGGDYSNITNEQLFVYNSDVHLFDVHYQDINVYEIKLNADLTLLPWLNSNVDIKHFLYEQDILSYYPNTIATVQFEQTLFTDKLSFNQSLYYLNRNDIVENNIVDPIPDVYDISVGVGYDIKPKIHLYFDARNLLGKEYIQWQNYENFGLNVLGGIRFLF